MIRKPKIIIIALSGPPGAGKTALAKELLKLPMFRKYEYFHGSVEFKKAAERAHLHPDDYYRYLFNHPEIERELDERQKRLMNQNKNRIIEGRIPPFLKCRHKKINVLLTVDPDEGIKRLLHREEYSHFTEKAMKTRVEERIAEEHKHFKKLHGIHDHLNPKYFDIVINTTGRTILEVRNKFIEKIREKFKPRT